MKVQALRNILNGMNDDDELVVIIYDREETEYLSDDQETMLTPKQWSKVVEQMHDDEGIHQQVSEAFAHYVSEAQ